MKMPMPILIPTPTPMSIPLPSRTRLRAITLASMLMLAGCLSLEKTYPEKQFYVLDAPRTQEAGAPIAGAPIKGTVLKVKSFRVAPPYDNKGLIYRHDHERFEADFYQEFFVPPAPMVTECTRRWLSDAGLFEHVVEASSQVVATHVLEGSVKALFADLSVNPPTAILELQIFLLDDTGAASRIAYQSILSKSIPLGDRSGPRIVAGWNQALREILLQVEIELRQVLGATLAPPPANLPPNELNGN